MTFVLSLFVLHLIFLHCLWKAELRTCNSDIFLKMQIIITDEALLAKTSQSRPEDFSFKFYVFVHCLQGSFL